MPRLLAQVYAAAFFSLLMSPCWSGVLQDSAIPISGSANRTWTSSDGNFRQEGKLVEIDGDKIRLETPQGKRITAPLPKLSAADKKFVEAERKRVAEDNPFSEDDEDNPFAAEMDAPSSDSETTRDKHEAISVNLSSAKMVNLNSNKPIDLKAERWTSKVSFSDIEPVQVPVASFHTRVENCFASQDGKILIVSLTDPFGSHSHSGLNDGLEMPELPENLRGLADRARGGRGFANRTQGGRDPRNRRPGNPGADRQGMKNWVELYQLPSGERLSQIPLELEEANAGDYDSQNKTLLVFGGTFHARNILQMYKLDGAGASLVKTCQFSNNSGGEPRLNSANYLADGKIVIGDNGKLLVLKENSLQPLYSISVWGDDWTLSSDRQHALVSHQSRQFEVDLINGKCTAAGPGRDRNSSARVPSPDGKKSAELTARVVTIRDAAGKTEDEFYVPIFWPQSQLTWEDERTLRVETPNQLFFVDVPSRVALLEINKRHSQRSKSNEWNIERHSDADGTTYLLSSQQALESDSSLPDFKEARASLPDEQDSLLLFKQGDRIALSVQLDSEPGRADEVKNGLKSLLQQRGVIVDDSAVDKLRVVSTVSQENVEYRKFGTPPWDARGTETVTVRRTNNSIELIRDGDVVWAHKNSTGGPGFMLHLQEGETVQQAVDRVTGQSSDFWQSFQLPRHVAVHPQGAGWFRYMATPEGYNLIQ